MLYLFFGMTGGFFGYSGKLNQRTPLVILIIDRVYFIIVPSKSVNKELLLLTFW